MNKKFPNLWTVFPILLFVIFITADSSYSQVKKYTSRKFKPSKVTIEVLFNYSQPLPNMFGEVGDLFSFKSYGVKYGLGSQINVKLSADKKGKIRPYISFGYSLFMGRNSSTAFLDTNRISIFPLPGLASFRSTPGTSRIFLHNFNVGPGFEYAFVNKTRWTPHIGAEFDLNILFGTYRQTPNDAAGAGPEGQVSFTIKQAVRFGFGVGAGIHLRVHKIVGFAFCTKYKFANVLGKNSNRTTEENKMDLLDKSATDLNAILSKDRHINFFEFMLGLVFHIGKL